LLLKKPAAIPVHSVSNAGFVRPALSARDEVGA
jgi:hypothetical protein